MKHYYYTFQYPSGKTAISGGLSGLCIIGDVNHDSAKVGDIVTVDHFNVTGTTPCKATIIGKLEFEWDSKKPFGSRKSNEKITGVGYKQENK